MDCPTYMCEEIMIEILSRLPAKSLVRLMAVCRLWKSIITSPQFLLSNRPTKLLVHTDRECYTLLEDDQGENRLMFETDFPLSRCCYDSAVVIGSDNGLLCIGFTKSGSAARGYKLYNNNYSRVIIWNPFIRKHVVVPDDLMDDNITYVIEYASGFGGTISSAGDYKYVRVVGLGDGEGVFKEAVDTYSLKAGTWRRKYLDWGIAQGMGDIFYTCALLRGRLHWFGGPTKQIFSFDLEDEVFGDIFTVPESIHDSFLTANVTVINESLAAIANGTRGLQLQRPAVWVMEEYGDVNSWIKLYNIDLSVENLYKKVLRNTVHLLKDGELLLCLVENYHPLKLKLVTFNPKTMKTRGFGGGALSSLPGLCGFTKNYKESLVLLADDYHAAPDQPTLQGRQHYGYYPAVRTGEASSHSLDRNFPMFSQRATYFHGYHPVWTGGPGFHWYPLFQDQYGVFFAWTGFHWLKIINSNPFLSIK